MQKKTLKHRLKYLIPVPIKKLLKFIVYTIEDIFNFFTGKNRGYPPKRLNFVGSKQFKAVGDEFAKYLVDLAGLKPSDSVLDIGSGIGRIAIPLTNYVQDGEYFGFDIDKRGVKWCQKNITKKFKHFHFTHADIFNKYYNKHGVIQAHHFKFPYEDNKFDVIYAVSVFTHMLTGQVEQYFKEASRVLKPGGKLLFTFFSIDDLAKENIKKGISRCEFKFKDHKGICHYSHKSVPEAETGFPQDWLIKELQDNGLAKNLKIYNGSWSGRHEFLSYQDIFIAEKS